VSDARARFDTGVRSSWGLWPLRPDLWSYSSLKDVESCPRRWMLSHAEYPDLWVGRGYPPMVASAALFGDVVHATLEVIVKALVAAGCESTRTADAVRVLKDLGGITAIAEQALEQRLAQLEENPRLKGDRARRLRIEIRGRLPDVRARVQVFLSRTVLPFSSRPRTSAWTGRVDSDSLLAGGRRPVGNGAHPELKVTAEELSLTGRIDLLTVGVETVHITDYKTGSEDPGHIDQLLTYALLWDLDRDVNPERRRATHLTVAYPSHELTVPAPTGEELRIIQRSIRARIAAAGAEVAAVPPRALPSDENCRYCQVRQLCPEYWEQLVRSPDQVPPGQWFDYEGVVAEQNGARSWSMSSRRTGRPELLLRTLSPSTDLRRGDRVRALGLRRDEDPESDVMVGAMTGNSELFALTEGAH
jgi:hypothetical protein